MFCKKCGSKITEDSLFCYKCGEQIVHPEKKAETAVKSTNNNPNDEVLVTKESIFKKCPHCNKEIKSGGEKCRYCGGMVVDINQDGNNRNYKDAGENKSIEPNKERIPWHQSFKWWHILILSFVSLLIYFGTYWEIFDWIFLIGFIFSIVVLVKSRMKKK